MRMISFVSLMRNASIPLFHQLLLFIVYESPLGLGFVSLSIKIAFVNLKRLWNVSLSVQACSLATRLYTIYMGAGIAQSVLRLATGWTVPETNRGGGEIFLGPTQPPVLWVPSLSPGVKRPWRGVDHPPQLAPRLKKEYRYTFTPTLGIRGLF